MTLAVRRPPPMRVAAFVEWAATRPDGERWELLDGAPALTAPPSERHQVIVANLLASLRKPAADAGCRALPGLAVVNDAIDDFAPIPDVVVRCGPIGPSGQANDPVFLAEVLSPSTMDDDRGRKSAFYKTLPSLPAFAVVFQNERRIEVWTRGESGWTFRASGAGATVRLARPAVTLAVDEVYAGLQS